MRIRSYPWFPPALAGVLLLFFPLFARADPRYEIIASHDRSAHRIRGIELILFENPTRDPMTEVRLFLYPNLYQNRNRFEENDLVTKAYPSAFSPAESLLLLVEDDRGRELTVLYEQGTRVARVFLYTPVPPGENVRLQIRFETVIPEKWGLFGYFRGSTYLQGGWHPMLAPLSPNGWEETGELGRSDFEILLTVDAEATVVGSGTVELAAERKDQKVLLLKGTGLRFYTLLIYQGYRTSRIRQHQIELVYTHAIGNQRYADRVLKVAEEAVDFFFQRYGWIPPRRLQMAEVHLYQDLLAEGEEILLVSARLFKVFPYLRRYHEARLIQGIFVLLWKARLPWEAEWVAEGLAARDAQTYLIIQYGRRTNLRNILQPIAFFPVIDQILYSGQLPLRQIYFSEPVIPPINEDIRFQFRERPAGRSIMIKLKNMLGEPGLERITDHYVQELFSGERPLFTRVSQQHADENLSPFFQQWLQTQPRIDFSIETVERMERNGSFQTTIVVGKEGRGVEPLKIHVREANGNEMILVWDGQGSRHQETIITPSPVRVVALDPDREIHDIDRFNDRLPRPWKVLLNRIGGGYDFQSREVRYNIEFAFRRFYDDRNDIVLNFTHNEEKDRGSISYTHVFLNRQGLSASLSFERPRFTQQPEKTSGIVGVGYRFSYPRVPLAVDYLQKLAGTVPPVDIALSYSQRFTGGEYDYILQLNMDMKKVVAFSNFHALAMRAFWGQSVGGLFKGTRFFLGGEDGLRGYTTTRFTGDNLSLFTIEYRFPITYGLDLNLGGLALFHAVQAALFADAGMVSHSHNTFRFHDYLTDAGISLRLFFDAFGFYPTILRGEVAYPLNAPTASERNLHWYVSAGQPF